MKDYKFKVGDLVIIDKDNSKIYLERYEGDVLKIISRKRSDNSYGPGERYLYKFEGSNIEYFYERRFEFYESPFKFELEEELFLV